MQHKIFLLAILLIFSCMPTPKTTIPVWEPYNEREELAQNADHESVRMRYKVIHSQYLDKNDIWKVIEPQISDFSEKMYQKLKPLIMEQDILTLQEHIQSGKLTYERLTQWYLYRIAQMENDREQCLLSILAINPDAVKEAKERDLQSNKKHPIYGMPILLKDNINTAVMPTTAGAVALRYNQTDDAFIVKQIKQKGGIILGKANLSEWAYFLCEDCPLGYSAMGGQTLNPYGRRIFETGGSSSGSGVGIAANYAAAAVGTETSGSILSPSSLNSVVGLKPTIGLLSRSGIVPITSTLDTPGPMTKCVTDNAILLSAMEGKDSTDPASNNNPDHTINWESIQSAKLKGLRLGVNKNFLEDSIYQATITKIKALGADTIEFTPEEMNFEGFVTFLNADMKVDLPDYLKKHAAKEVKVKTVADIVAFNKGDSSTRIPYGQALFEGIVAEDISTEEFAALKKRFLEDGIAYFEKPMKANNLDAILSINNYEAGQAAMAQYPCLTVPMGYKESGEPIGLTFIARPWEEGKLLQMGYAFEQETKVRRAP